MKNNYVKTGLTTLMALCVFGYTSVNAQTKVSAVITAGPATFDINATTGLPEIYQLHAVDAAVVMKGTATVTGHGTFDVSFTVTPGTGLRVIQNSTEWGITNTATSVFFRGNQSSFCTINNITYSNFTGSMTSGKISSSTLKDVVIGGGTNAQDRFAYQVGSTEYISTGNTVTDPKTYNLLTYGPVDLAAGSALTSLTSVIIRSGSTRSGSGSDAWYVHSLEVEVTLDDTTLGVNDFNRVSKTGLIVSPNPVVNSVSLNMTVKSAEIIDMTGRTVKSFNGETESLDVSGLVSGTYILKAINQEGKVFTSKIIK